VYIYKDREPEPPKQEKVIVKKEIKIIEAPKPKIIRQKPIKEKKYSKSYTDSESESDGAYEKRRLKRKKNRKTKINNGV